MSEDEKAAAIGRLVLEYGETSKELALLSAEAQRLGAYLKRLGELLVTWQHLEGRHGSGRTESLTLDDFPTRERLECMLGRIAELRAVKAKATECLKNAGYEPKD